MKINFVKNFQQFDKISNSLYLSAKVDISKQYIESQSKKDGK